MDFRLLQNNSLGVCSQHRTWTNSLDRMDSSMFIHGILEYLYAIDQSDQGGSHRGPLSQASGEHFPACGRCSTTATNFESRELALQSFAFSIVRKKSHDVMLLALCGGDAIVCTQLTESLEHFLHR